MVITSTTSELVEAILKYETKLAKGTVQYVPIVSCRKSIQLHLDKLVHDSRSGGTLIIISL